ncbi:MAG TPA: DUF4038 domain-containing protein [Bacteroidota bacterium]|nr:DUF4038 domain-containing protein [Bacteroidota bacterium]
MKRPRLLFLVAVLMQTAIVFIACTQRMIASGHDVVFTAPSDSVAAYDYIEISATVIGPLVSNPFTEATLTGTFVNRGTGEKWSVVGFSDSEEGSLYRIRFMPPMQGVFDYDVAFKDKALQKSFTGALRAFDGHRRGLLRVDPKYRWHFIWSGTGEHYFFNGTTAYWLMGWKDERIIEYSLERLHRLKVNRLRVTISGREDVFFGEPVMNGENFSTYLTPWPSRQESDVYHPGYADMYHPDFDYTRFDLGYWRKFERALRFARERDVIISLVLDMNDNKVHPGAGSEDEHRFIQYAIARFGAFSNITWDLGDDLERYRSDAWTHETGTLIKSWDPYKHLATSHPVDNVHQDRTADWFDFTSFQEWSRQQHAFILKQRRVQEETGRIIPQANEEYGYEDHYPIWAPGPGSETADVLRRTAWDIYMAGGYQTAGESARRGTNIWPDTGGGWLNGRGDDDMTMFLGFGHIVDFFSLFEWWKTNPHDELVGGGNYCLAEPGRVYAIYLPRSGNVTVHLEPGEYSAFWYGATTGEKIKLPDIQGPTWQSPQTPDRNDWALLITRKTL